MRFPTWTSSCSWLYLENAPLIESLNGAGDEVQDYQSNTCSVNKCNLLPKMQTRQLFPPCRDHAMWEQLPE